MNRTLRIGLLLLAVVLGYGPTCWAQALKYGLVYIVYDDGEGNCLYIVDVDVNSTCSLFEPAFAWESASPSVAVPWVNCQGDFLFKVADAEKPEKPKVAMPFTAEPYDPFTNLKSAFPYSRDPAEMVNAIKSRIPRSAKFAGRRQRWNPQVKAGIEFVGLRKIGVGSGGDRMVALFSLTPNTEQDPYQLERKKLDQFERRIDPIDFPFHQIRRYFAFETDAASIPGPAIPAKEAPGQFKYQYRFEERNVTVPVILTR